MTWLPKLVIGRIVPVAVRNASAASKFVSDARVRSALTVRRGCFGQPLFLLVSHKR